MEDRLRLNEDRLCTEGSDVESFALQRRGSTKQRAGV